MAENIENINQEEQGIDFMALAKKIWDGRKTVYKALAVFLVLGLISAFTMKRVYSVQSVMVPQMSSKGASSSLSSLRRSRISSLTLTICRRTTRANSLSATSGR